MALRTSLSSIRLAFLGRGIEHPRAAELLRF
jgi:hypothetical protein